MKNDMRGSVVTERPILKGLLTEPPKRVAFWLTVKKTWDTHPTSNTRTFGQKPFTDLVSKGLTHVARL